ncbi:MAG: aromatic ring-hydroxylating dioxygenase subunit alpha [Halofilum sp. (in: g-proteobacteria)]|nr:aromatic ring-hydroxylating dioxygenase subunit alpha [Halofilum sp. (in: g-proteobacteria)]
MRDPFNTAPRGAMPAGVENVLADTASASGLPNGVYTDPAFLPLERDTVFAPTWTALGFASDVTEPGEVHPTRLLGVPLIMLRDRQGEVRVFHNVCSHRGRQLVDQPTKVEAGLRCPYHSWHYGLDGSLKGTPHIGGMNCHSCEGFDKSRHGLREVRCAVWCDIVFVNLDGNAASFEDYIEPVMRRWEAFWGRCGPRELRPAGPGDGQLVLDVEANWKLAVENYCESYHLPWVHPGLNSYSRLEDHYIVLDEDGESFAGQGTRVYNLAEVAGITMPKLSQWPREREREAEYLSLYPNALIGLQADRFFVVLLEPISEQRTREHLRISYVGDAAVDDEHAAARESQLQAWRTVFEEDVSMVEGMQRGRASPAYGGGVFSPVQDIPTHHFHQWVARRLVPASVHAAGQTRETSSA